MREIFISAGEASGDKIGEDLIRKFKEIDPSIKISCIGGLGMRKASDVCIYESERISVTGLFEVAKKLKEIYKAWRIVKEYLMDVRPDAVVLIDFPGFNFRLGKFLKKEKINVYYYVSPQVWAWGEKRVHTIASFSKRIFVIFPFEVDFYKERGIENVEYVGHPVVDRIRDVSSKNFTKDSFGFDKRELIALLPGSRENEIAKNIEIIEKIPSIFPDFQYALCFPEGMDGFYKGSIRAFYGKTLEILSISDAAIITSGTATLEAALLGVPGVVVYKLMFLSYIIGKIIVKTRYIAIPNIILGDEVYPELIQKNFTLENLCDKLKFVMAEREKIARRLKLIKSYLEGNASYNVASRILEEV